MSLSCSVTHVLIRRHRDRENGGKTQRQGGWREDTDREDEGKKRDRENGGKTQAEIGVICLQDEAHQRWTAVTRSEEETREDSPSESSEGTNLANTSVLGF